MANNYHGLSKETLALLASLFAPYASHIDKVGLFGSRATGKHKPYSDIDLVVYGEISKADIQALHTACIESSLAYEVDVCGYEHAPQELKSHIDAVMQPLFLRSDLIKATS